MFDIASVGGGRLGKNSLGGRRTNTVCVLMFATLSFRIVGHNGIRHSPVLGHLHPRSIAPLVTVILTSLASYTLTSSLSKTVM
jgi:hypothetical protein